MRCVQCKRPIKHDQLDDVRRKGEIIPIHRHGCPNDPFASIKDKS